MILSTTVRQEVSYRPVGYELNDKLERLQRLGYKIISVTETKVDTVRKLSNQGFIIVYEC
jgi:hypothetical protein